MQDKATNKFNPKIWFNFDKGLNNLSSSIYTNHIHYGKKNHGISVHLYELLWIKFVLKLIPIST